MKIIDLAEKQRNNEILPKHIRFENEDFYFDGVTYYDEEGNNDLFDILAMNNNALTHLYDEVEIIEEEKKIPEKIELEPLNLKDNLQRQIEAVHYENIMISNAVNEIIDYLKSKGDNK